MTLGKLALYTVAGNGDLTLVAVTGNSTSLFQSGARSANWLASYAKVAGQRYAFGMLGICTSGFPNPYGLSVVQAECARDPRMCAVVWSQSDIPSSIAAGLLNDTNTMVYGIVG